MTTTEVELHRLELAYADLRVVDRRSVARMAADLATEGQRQPVLVVPREGRLVLIDGYCRVAALRKLGRDTVQALTLALSERDALLFAHRSGAGRRRFALEDGWLLQELIERFGMSQAELARVLGRSVSFVSRRLALVVQLPASVQEAVRDGRIGAYAAQRSLVPLARANKDHAERLVANLGSSRPTTRQITVLYSAWRTADRETRERIVDHPELFLRVESASTEPRAGDAVTDLVRALETVSGACHGARKRLRDAALHHLEGADRTAITRAFTESRLAFVRRGPERALGGRSRCMTKRRAPRSSASPAAIRPRADARSRSPSGSRAAPSTRSSQAAFRGRRRWSGRRSSIPISIGSASCSWSAGPTSCGCRRSWRTRGSSCRTRR